MKLSRLILLLLGLFYVSIGFTMSSARCDHFILEDEFDQIQNSELETELKAVSEDLFESNIVYTLTFQKDGYSKNNPPYDTHKYSGIYFYRTASIYQKSSRLIDPGLNRCGIIFPFHDYI